MGRGGFTAGFYIVEAMVALGVLVFGFLGLLTLLANSLSLNRVVSDTYTANYLALEGVEIVKNVVDANIAYGQNRGVDCAWNAGFKTAAIFETDWQLRLRPPQCPGEVFATRTFRGTPYIATPLSRDEKGRYGYPFGGKKTSFLRRIEVFPIWHPGEPASNPPNELRVNSFVNWTTRGGGQFEVNVEDHFYNWARP